MKVNIADPLQTPATLWQKALDQSASGILVAQAIRNKDGDIETFTIQLANRQAEKTLRHKRESMLGHTVAELLPQTLAPLWSKVADVVESGESQHSDFYYQTSYTRQELWFDLCIEPLGDGQCAVLSFTDITALKNASQTLLGESILFKTLSSSVPGMSVVVVNYFQKVLFANGNLPGLFKSSNADELIGQRITDTILPNYQDDWKRYISTALMGEQHSFSDHWGGWRCECYVGPVRNERGNIVMGICVYRDISEQFRQQQTLQRMNHDLKQSNHSLEQFAYVASHDLQEPLRKIKSFGDILGERYTKQLDETGVDIVHRMQSAADRMNDLIKSLLSYARITTPSGLAKFQKQELINVSELLSGIQNDLEIAIQERGAVIKSDLNLPIVPGDETQLRQLFQNLLTNAIKFVRPTQRPEVSITGRLVRGGDVPEFPGVDHLQEYALFSIEDNGIGIDPENFEMIFGLFTRLHGRQQFTGSGIGLATCKRVAENHGGTITLESKVNYGTTFHVYLPLHTTAQKIQ
ncbi:ATP-binding protein [Spirosoma sp. RP8]|uniref:histidine kinase n=1 Tax=Spirosoma liriopis TaxID=2937440 RepID=A0ABT0HPA1_9BACT|nr:PAS domain-containing sensor histidine kinase [Spirosoma liriopis]MCK8494001.1 ATP-binding protein [Spirosoma liriopis]